LTHFTGEFERTLAIAGVLVPVPVRPKDAAVFRVRAGLDDAFTALFIENGAFRTVCWVKFAVASAGFGIPLAVRIAVNASTAF